MPRANGDHLLASDRWPASCQREAAPVAQTPHSLKRSAPAQVAAWIWHRCYQNQKPVRRAPGLHFGIAGFRLKTEILLERTIGIKSQVRQLVLTELRRVFPICRISRLRRHIVEDRGRKSCPSKDAMGVQRVVTDEEEHKVEYTTPM